MLELVHNEARISAWTFDEELHWSHCALLPLRPLLLASWWVHSQLRVWLVLASCFFFRQLLVEGEKLVCPVMSWAEPGG